MRGRFQLLEKAMQSCYAGQRYIQAMDRILQGAVAGGSHYRLQLLQGQFEEWKRRNDAVIQLHHKLSSGG